MSRVASGRELNRARSIAACVFGDLLREAADIAAGVMLGLYLGYLNDNVRQISALQVSLVGVGLYVASILLTPIIGGWSDHRGRKPFMLLGPAIGLVVVMFYPLTTSLLVIFLLLTVEGISEASEQPATLGYLADATEAGQIPRGRVMALQQIASLIATGLGFVLGGIAWDILGLTGFRALALLYFASGMVFYFGVSEIVPSHSISKASLWAYKDTVTKSGIVVLLGPWLAVNAIIGAWFAQITFQLSSSSQATQTLQGAFSGTSIGLIWLAGAAVFAAGMYAGGVLADRANRITVMIASLLSVYGLSYAVYRLNQFPDLSLTADFLLLLAVGLTSLFPLGWFIPATLTLLADRSDLVPDRRGGVMGLAIFTVALGRLLGGLMGGMAADAGGIDGLALLSTMLGTLALLLLLATRHRLETR